MDNMMMDDILIPVSPGELIDKLTILRLKRENITDLARLANVRHEETVLLEVAAQLPPSTRLATLQDELFTVNARLWQVEDDIRACEAAGDFGHRFITLARSVYRLNDDRAALKKAISQHLGSRIVEEKSYADYGTAELRHDHDL